MKAGCVLSSLTLPMASRSEPSASGLAGLLKPIWLSLICAKVKAEPSAASTSSSRPKDFGTPPDTVHKTPVPAQIMHSRAPRRSTSRPPIFRLELMCPRSRGESFMTLSHPLGVSIPRARELTRATALRSRATTPQPTPHDVTGHSFASVAKGPSESRKKSSQHQSVVTRTSSSLRTSALMNAASVPKERSSLASASPPRPRHRRSPSHRTSRAPGPALTHIEGTGASHCHSLISLLFYLTDNSLTDRVQLLDV